MTMNLRLRLKRFQRWLHSILPYRIKRKYSPEQVADQFTLAGTWIAVLTLFFIGMRYMFSSVRVGRLKEDEFGAAQVRQKPVTSLQNMPGIIKKHSSRYLPDKDGNFHCLQTMGIKVQSVYSIFGKQILHNLFYLQQMSGYFGLSDIN